MPTLVHLDVELSGVSDLKKVGADVWTKRKDTHPTVLSFAIDDNPIDTLVFDSKNTHKSTAGARERLAVVTHPDTQILAWNAPFEFGVWNNILADRFQWPRIPLSQFHCVMATAACAGLPMSLDQAADACGSLFVKDKKGAANMKRMARPRREDPLTWWHLTSDEKLDALIEYNRADVEAERAIWQIIPRMTANERALWLIDQKMQLAGLPVDSDLLDKLAKLTEHEMHHLNFMLDAVTQGVVTSFTQNTRILHYVQARGYPRDSLARDVLEEFMGHPLFQRLPLDAQEVLQLRLDAAKTSTAKLASIKEFSQIDGNARHLAQYGGAVRTLRWAGRGPQIQNFPRPIIKDVPGAIDAIKKGADDQALRLIWGKPLDVVSSCLRGVFCAPKGKLLVVCDYSAIEARVVAWLSLHGAMLQVFQRGDDVYVFAAQQQGSNNRQFGKVLILACGYGMGAAKFQETALVYGVELTLDEADLAVQNWRSANWPIVNAWYSCEQQAMRAISNPRMSFPVNGLLEFRMGKPDGKLAGALLMTLPSGRRVVYRDARIVDGGVVYNGVNQYTRKWEELRTYGGKLIENATQATARDIMADALVKLDAAGWGDNLRQTVHDEIIAIADEGDAQELFDAMRVVMRAGPAWAKGLPLAATGYVNERYAKS